MCCDHNNMYHGVLYFGLGNALQLQKHYSTPKIFQTTVTVDLTVGPSHRKFMVSPAHRLQCKIPKYTRYKLPATGTTEFSSDHFSLTCKD